eukprot:s3228_g11.t1
MWRSTLCPPAWANADCPALHMGGVMDAFQHHLFPFGQMVTLRLYQSVFRFERDGQAASSDILRRTGEQLEALRQLACLVNYQRCWSRGRAQSWKRGVQSLCRTLLAHQLPSVTLLPGFCASLLNKGPVQPCHHPSPYLCRTTERHDLMIRRSSESFWTCLRKTGRRSDPSKGRQATARNFCST